MTKYVKISVLARETAKKVCRGREQWIRYLDVASRLYKYPFEDQLLIYAQRPDATACASLEMWNERMFCWVNRGAKGIALIDGESERPKLRYVFDVSDVHKARRIGKDPFIWHLREEHKEVVLAELEHIYGSTNDALPFENRIYEIAERIAEDFYEEAVDEVIDEAANSFLEDLDGDAVAVRFREMLVQSVSYTILKRCGCDMTEFADDFTFDYIHEFNTLRTLSVLGSTTSELCEPVLIRIGRTIARYDRALLHNKSVAKENKSTERVIREEDFVIGIDSNTGDWFIYDNVTTSNICYCDSEENAKEHIRWMVANNQFYKTERAVAGHESDIRKERGLSDSQSDTFGAGRNDADEIRSVAEELSEKPQEGDLHGTSFERRTADTLPGDTGTGRGEVRGADTEVVEEPDRDGGNETERSAAVDERDEPDLSAGRGDRSEGTGLSVAELEQYEPPADSPYRQMDLFSLMSEQVGNIAMAQAEMPSDRFLFGTITAGQIEEILRTGGGKENSRKRIYHKYQTGKTPEEMAAFLQKEYGETGKGFQLGGEQISVWFNEDGMYAAHGTSAFEHTELHLSWSAVESVIRGQIEAGSYIDSNEAYLAEQFVRKELADMLFFYFRDSVGTFPEELGISGYNYPGEHEYIVDMLAKEDEVRKVIAQMDRTIQRVEKGELEYRFRLAKDPQELRDDLADFLNERVEFPLPEDINVVTEDFITADEIDHTLTRGSGFVHGSFRIYDFYHQKHTLKEAADFLKNEYGTGGASHALAGSDHSYKDYDAKGIKLSKGSIFTPDAEVLLSWQVVAKRIGKLIKEDRYLTPAAKEKYAQYKQEQKEKALQQAKEELDGVIGEPEVLLENNALEDISAENYVISDMELGVGTAKEKFQRNVEAIRTLETIESEKRPATNEEQEVLSKYVGWGGLADAFDETKSVWAKEYAELKALLSEEEYISARESTLNAHYTSPVIIQGIYRTLQRMGITKGNLLEPSMGIGNFFGMLPETMRESHLYGVELDSLTGRIARLLYPKANITVDGYEKTAFPNDFFDAAVGNVPFGQYKVADKKYDKYNFLIHDYFFGKTLDQVRPGGVIYHQ